MRHKLDPVLNIFPKWRALLRTATAEDGSAFEVLEVPAPEGSDAAAGLLGSTANGQITVSVSPAGLSAGVYVGSIRVGDAVVSGAYTISVRAALVVGPLPPGLLVRLRLQDGRVTLEERYLAELRERIRDVVQSPDGSLYLLTDSSRGRILRVDPAR